MHRRTFLAGSALLAALPGAATAQAGAAATPHEVLVALGTGKTVLLGFHGADCASCAAQGTVIEALRENSPGLADAVTFLTVDFGAHGQSDLARALEVEQAGTLIVLKGGSEYGRLVGESGTEAIRALVETAYKVATG